MPLVNMVVGMTLRPLVGLLIASAVTAGLLRGMRPVQWPLGALAGLMFVFGGKNLATGYVDTHPVDFYLGLYMLTVFGFVAWALLLSRGVSTYMHAARRAIRFRGHTIPKRACE